ncbi:MAG: hypothetical protein Q8P66_02305 [Candidatus Colwellbacteria bacterium]|nr:hypothetical protein [Candidatus Colwellbacteria bacterium]
MKLPTAILGSLTIIIIFIAFFYAYSHLSERKVDSLLPQTATIADFNNEESAAPKTPDEKLAANSSATTTPSLGGFKENELQEGLEGIKAGLDLLKNPIE